MNPQLSNKVLNYVAVSSALTKKALDELQVHRAAQQKAASVRPELLARMLQVGAIAEHQKQAGEAMLASHPETLSLLKLAVDKIEKLQGQVQKSAADLGQGVEDNAGVKTAGDYDSMNDPFVGRRTSQRKASDVAILRVLNS